MFRKLFAHNHLALLLLSVAWLTAASAAYAQGTGFTYQGRLTEDGSPSDGTYDMQFILFDTPDLGTGSEQAPPFIIPDVTITNGVFTVQLDFGLLVFNGAASYLEIGIRPAGSPDPYTLLGPRQPVASTPYAIRSLSAATADTAATATTATNATTAATATNATQLGGLTASQFIQNKTSQQGAANFNISGSGTAGGTLSASVVNANTHYNILGTRVLSVDAANNVFVGGGAGTSNTAANNSFFGASAGVNNTTGGNNSFFGAAAGFSNTTGVNNSFFGRFAGSANTTASSNSFFGAFTGQANTTGFSNSFFGSSAGMATTTGGNNSFFGFRAGMDNTIGCCNSFFGTSAGQENTLGGSNSFFGFYAGTNNTSGSGNTFVGKDAGQSNVTENYNTFIGFQSNGAAGITNATAIGANAFVNQSNSLVLGSGTNVGIGTSAPQDKLHVLGIIRVSTLGAAGSTQLCRNASNQIASCSSSLRYKEQVETFIPGLDLINRLRPISFTWRQGGERDLGLAAEEVSRVEPLLVTRNERGEVEGVKYDRITVALINAIKQQQSQIDSLKKIVCMDRPDAEICK